MTIPVIQLSSKYVVFVENKQSRRAKLIEDIKTWAAEDATFGGNDD